MDLQAGGGDDTLVAATGSTGSFDGGGDTDMIVHSGGNDQTLSNDSLNVDSATKNLFGIETASLTGSSADNLIRTIGFTNGSVTLAGGEGNDTFEPSSSNDQNDSIDGGGGSEDAISMTFSNSPLIELTDSSFSGIPGAGIGTDSIGGIERATIGGGPANQLIDAGGLSGLVSLTGGSGGSDTLVSGSGLGDQTLAGGSGTPNRAIRSAAASQVITGGAITGGGTVGLSNIQDVSVSGGPGPDELDASGYPGMVSLAGGGGDDSLYGNNQSNLLDGGPGTDLLRPRTSAADAADDTLVGGTGIDAVDYIGSASANESLTLDDQEIQTGANTKSLEGIEVASILGGTGDNDFEASSFSGPVSIDGAPGENTLTGGPAADTITGGDDTDLITGGPGSDALAGGAGIDTLVQAADADQVLSDTSATGSGNDTIAGFEEAELSGGPFANLIDASAFTGGPVLISGGAGEDTLAGSPASDSLSGGADPDLVIQQSDNDQQLTESGLTGNGTDTLDSIERADLTGGPSANLIDASAFSGPTTLEGLAGADTLTGGTGIDLVRQVGVTNQVLSDSEVGGDGPDQISGIETASLVGTTAADSIDASAFTLGPVSLTGLQGDDTLVAGQADTELLGDGGADSLVGGTGLDLLSGGDGDDTLDSQAGNPTVDANDCGADQDEAITDPDDTAINCEVVNGEVVDPPDPDPDPDDTVAPVTKLNGPARQAAKGKRVKVKVFASCNEACSVRVRGRVHYKQRVKKNGNRKLAKRTMRLKTRNVTLRANQRRRVVLKLKPGQSRKLIRMLKRKAATRPVARLKGVARDEASNRSKAARKNVRITVPRGKGRRR